MVGVLWTPNLPLQTLFMFYDDLLAASYDFAPLLGYPWVFVLPLYFPQVGFLLLVPMYYFDQIPSTWVVHTHTMYENVSIWMTYGKYSYTTILQEGTTITICSI